MGDIPNQAASSILTPSETPQFNNKAHTAKHQGHRWIWFITGPTACGKPTVAKALAKNPHFTFVEGDDPTPNKMSLGQTLTDQDRKDWLEALRDHETAQASGPNAPPHLAKTCSALKRHYRDVLREGGLGRAAKRKGHFAGANLVHSQFEALERPGREERDVIVVGVQMMVWEVMMEDYGSYLKVL
ncbi:hypothetical protein B0T18DRAFT_434266 [Schizothecium vesticola]|uniref:gluconokinase n=1 Tax=Schizothecium vesticola TaxID=314040 RepID=A0AA40F967_9PEZI|nr:hypothetical protein B0T18DRAFT_434266 [Schizothecium vesticola]